MAVDPEQVARSADDLIEHYGQTALEVARQQVERASRTGDHPALDLALMVLTEIERRQTAESNL
ncbi:hypothetical protein [Magnetospirillum gryphiswaldense]|uniref:hypothetical protein n=1 Tax=Magnetospirillum gryphiswaldense TaxID=55518 RepID=UPI000AC714F8|nr:hypothetical protein [Magnetospirillum gryphiswaldense]